MNPQEKRVSDEDFISRTQPNREKPLHLEEELMVARGTIERLENELKIVLKEKEQALQQAAEDMKKFYSDLIESEHIDYQKKIADYEEKLTQIRTELDEKEKQMEACNQQIKSLETGMNLHKSFDSSLAPSVDGNTDDPDETKNGYSSVAYFDCTIIFYGNKTGLIKGSLHLENTGLQPLENPYICLRFNPADAAKIKGKILSQEKMEAKKESLADFHWRFVDDEWAMSAKERGEIWICPTQEMKIMPGESVSCDDYRIPFKKGLYKNITIEAFVFYNKKQFKIKAANHINVHFKQYCSKCINKESIRNILI